MDTKGDDAGPDDAGIVAVLRLQMAETDDADVALDGEVMALALVPVRAVRIDRNVKESVQAWLRAKVERLLARYNCPPDKKERTIELVLEQLAVLAVAA